MPASTVTKTYTELSTIPKAVVGKCNAVLSNHMQCWRAGDVQVQITTVTPGAVTTAAPTVAIQTYQLCRAHALYEQQQDVQLAALETKLAEDQAAVTAATATKK